MKKLLKKVIKATLTILTIDFFFRKFIKNDNLVLLYHDVSNDPSDFHLDNNLNVSIENFKLQLKFLKKFYYPIEPKEIGKIKNKPSLLITFDDGQNSYFKNALPILLKKKIPSIHFLNFRPIKGGFFLSGFAQFLKKSGLIKTKKKLINFKLKDINKFVKKNEIFKKSLKYYGKFSNLATLKKYQNNKYVFYGNHFYDHLNAAILSKKEIKQNYDLNKKNLKKLKNYLDFFSYPYGEKNSCYTEQTDNFIKNSLNAKKIFYADTLSFNRGNKEFIHRLAMDNEMSEINFKKEILFFKFRNFFLRPTN